MLLPFKELFEKYSVKCNGLIHVGANISQEHEDYRALGIQRIIYIEPCNDAFNVILDKHYNDENVILYNVACGDKEDMLPMYVSHQNQGQSNSLLRPSGHLTQHPEIKFDDTEVVRVVRLDNLDFKKKDYNFLVMDCQGGEGDVIKGGTETLKHIDYIYTEINSGDTYEGNMLIDDFDKLLSDFTRVETFYPSPNLTWGDALYVRTELLNK